MRKVTYADQILVSNCECCGGVQLQLWRKGKMFALACPADADSAMEFTEDLLKAVKVMRAAEGKPHVH